MKNKLIDILMNLPLDINLVEQEVKNGAYTSDDISFAMCQFVDECFMEVCDFECDNDRKPEPEELHSTYLYKLCEMLLNYGLNPNAIFGEKYNRVNLMYQLKYVDNGYIGADTLRLLLENGGNPNLVVDENFPTSIFEDIDFDVMFDVHEGYYEEDREWVDKLIHCWFVLSAFVNEADKDLKDHKCYDHALEYTENGKKLKIFKVK